MNRNERINEMMRKPMFKDWNRRDIEMELNDWSNEDINKGYAIFDFDGTGMLEIQEISCMNIFNGSDEDAVKQASKDGIKFIPINELPDNFERKYLGWIDTPENRMAIEEYCK